MCQPALSTCGNCEVEFSTPAAEGITCVVDCCHVLLHCIYMYQILCIQIHVSWAQQGGVNYRQSLVENGK